MIDPLPCPFCGSAAETDSQQGYRALSSGKIGTAVAVYCTACEASMSVCREDVPDIELDWLVEQWNRRTKQAADAGE